MNKFISIIIPVLNSAKYLEICLSSLMDIDYPKDKFEIIVVDNGSSDNTIEIAEKYKVKLLQQTKCTISALRNLGAKHSRGEILAFIDADCIAPKCWLTKAVELFENSKIGAVGCWYSLPQDHSIIEDVWDVNTLKRRSKVGFTDWIPSSNFIIRKSIFIEINGFNENLATSEDFDICQRLISSGMNLYSHPQLSVVHLRNPKNLKEFFFKERWRGIGVLQNFIYRLPKLNFNNAILIALLDLILFLTLAPGIIIWGFTGNKLLLIFSLALLLSIHSLSSIKNIYIAKRWKYLFPLMFLNLVYGFSRATSIFELKVWKCLFEPKSTPLDFNAIFASAKLRKNIIFVAPRFPYPADTGAKIRTLNLLKNIAKENKVSLLSFRLGEDRDAIEKIKELGIDIHTIETKEKINPLSIFSNKPISIEKYYSKKMRRKLKELVKTGFFDLVHFDHLHMGQYKDCVNGLPCVLDEHNVEAIILDRCATVENRLFRRIVFKWQAKKMAHLERDSAQRFSKCLTVSESDKENLFKLSGNKADIEVIPNGVDTEYFRDSPLAIHKGQSPSGTDPTNWGEQSLVFTGSMDWLPNADAIIYFCKDILPLILDKNNRVKFYIVGKNPTKDVLKLAKQDKRIVVVGLVDDVRPYIAGAKVFVVPIRIGGGTRLKILEAMAMEKAVVSTRIGAEGIAYTEGKDIILGDSPQDFADAVLMLLEDNQKRDELGKAGRDLVCRNYDWKIIGEKLNQVYRMVVANDRQR